MKNKILLLALLASSGSAFAQNKISYGFKVGVTNASLKGDAVNSLNDLMGYVEDYVSAGSSTGVYTGAFVNLPVGNTFSFEPGFYITQKGYQMKAGLDVKPLDALGVGAKAKLKLNYFDIPLLLKAKMGGLTVFGGPQFSYLRNADLKIGAGVLGINIISTKIPVGSQFNRWDVGYTAGLGYEFSNGFSLSASYDQGLNKIDKNKSLDVYNRVVKLGIGFRF